MDQIELISPAKINIGLNVLSKRKDDFHNIETIFYPIKLHDKIEITKYDDFFFSSNYKFKGDVDNNLIIRAKKTLEKKLGKELNVKIHLEKVIPLGAGLGGGSSNAASVLLGLAELFELDITKEELKEIGLGVGSDVPFFIDPSPSFASGRGDRLIPLPDFKIDTPLVIINPGIHISTHWAYKNITSRQPEVKLSEIVFDKTLDFDILKKYALNDFEGLVFKQKDYKIIKEIKEKMYEMESLYALMSGTGSTVYAFFENVYFAEKAASLFSRHYFRHIE